MQTIEILKGTLKGQTFRLTNEYTAVNGKQYYSFDLNGDGRIIRRVLQVNAKKV